MALKRKAAGILAAALIISMLPVTAFAAEVSDTTDSEDTTTVTVTETEEDTEDSAESESAGTTTDSDTEDADETDIESEVLAAILEILNSASEDSETTGTVTASALNVRCGAGMDYSVIDVIYRGDTVQVLGEDGSWYEITYDDVEGYVYSDYLTVTESSSGVSINLDSDSVNTLISLLYSSGDGDDESEALTPDGNLTLVDDYGSSTEAGKQYITLVTKSGNYFYLIIDRDDEGEETVHFLNLVDESDLLSLMDEDEAAEYESSDADDEDVAETVDEDADDTSTEDEEDVEDEEETEESSGGSNTLILLVLFVIGVGAVGLFLYKKIGSGKKPAKTNGPDPDEDDDEPGYNLPIEDNESDEPDEE